jgi:peroxiredoxin
MIQTGDKLPSVPVKLVDASGASDVDAAEALGSGRVVLFGVPGAFTPTCDTSHLPGFIAAADRLKAAGIERIVCATVNDHHVVKAWAERSGALGKIDFIADAHGRLADATGLSKDFGDLGRRFSRFAMILRDGIVEHCFVQDAPGVTVSGAPAILLVLQGEEVA